MALLKPRSKNLQEKDKKYLWHPFTQMKDWAQEDIVIIERGEGVYLIDVEGKKYLDGVSSLWCNVHGHQVPEIDEALKAQIGKISHSTFLGLSNVPAIELAEKLIRISPKGLTRVFYSDSGSEAVEIALKMAYQYWQQSGKPKKQKFLKLENAYHGDTLGSVSVGGIGLFHQIYNPLLFATFCAPSPYAYRWQGAERDASSVNQASLAKMEEILAENHDQIAAIIMEPLMQGAAGMIHQQKGYISRVRKLANKYNTLLIFDEVATGFGRTGKMFASDHENVTPDLLVAAKGLTGGYLPLAVTITTEKVYEAFLGEYTDLKTFFHGHTFTANPLACAAAIANLDLFERNKTLETLNEKIKFVSERLKKFYDLKCVGDIRQIGLMIGVELVKDRAKKTEFELKDKIGIRVIEEARRRGVIIRPLGPVIVLMPPLAMTPDHLGQLLNVTYDSIKEVTEK